MIDLDALEPLFNKIDLEPDSAIKKKLFDIFKTDFIDNPFFIDGKKIKVILANSKVEGFYDYPETFVHIITRKSKITGKRSFIPDRANRIHWVKNILLQKDDDRINFFKWVDDEGILKDHYWFVENNYMVVVKPLPSNVLIISAFCVDNDEQLSYSKKYQEYRKSIK